jgi:predicted Zn-dependent protease
MVSARVLYGQLLHERVMPDNALQHLRYAWEHGRGSTAAVIPICNILREQGKEKECVELLEKAVERNPRDAFLWNYLGQSRRTLKDRAGAAAAFAKSADLMPENQPMRTQAGEEFEASGDRVRAEQQYRLLVQQDPESAAGHYFLARCLARDTARRDEALSEAQAALRLADKPGSPPKSQIQALIAAIRAGRTGPEDQFKL